MGMSDRLRDLRLQKGVSLQELADDIGLSKTHVWELEKGRAKNPTIDMIQKLAEYYRVSVSFLIAETDVEDAENAQILRMFKQVSNLEEGDRLIVEDMIASIAKRKGKFNED